MRPLFVKVWYRVPRNNIRDYVLVRNTGQSDEEIVSNARNQLQLLGWVNIEGLEIEEKLS